METEIACLDRKIQAAAHASDTALRLTSVPGIGALTASAIVAAVGSGKQFKRARDLSAWIGLTPAEYSTG
ncbi:transposase, partial [Serratia marcescens]|uniref:transposase n=1 Tax=Serratia marcescens TaxID=615 RepID=UPI0013DD809B